MNHETKDLLWLVFAVTYGVGLGHHAPLWLVNLSNLVSFVLAIVIIVDWVRNFLARRRKKASRDHHLTQKERHGW